MPDDVFVEGGATWMEDEVHDAADDNHYYLWPLFRQSLGDYDGSPYPYWITFRGFTERYGTGSAGGSEQVMQDFWELTSQNAKATRRRSPRRWPHRARHWPTPSTRTRSR